MSPASARPPRQTHSQRATSCRNVILIRDHLRLAHRALLCLETIGRSAGCPGIRGQCVNAKSDQRARWQQKATLRVRTPAPGCFTGSCPKVARRHGQPAPSSRRPQAVAGTATSAGTTPARYGAAVWPRIFSRMRPSPGDKSGCFLRLRISLKVAGIQSLS